MKNKYIMDVKPVEVAEVKEQIKTWVDETYQYINSYSSYLDLVIAYSEVLDDAIEKTKYPQLFQDSEMTIYYMDDEQNLHNSGTIWYKNEYRIISPNSEYEA